MTAFCRPGTCFLLLGITAFLLGSSAGKCADNSAGYLYALIVGGGPDVENNAAQIEGHVRFFASILPASTRRIVLFADGKSDQPTVSYADPSAEAQAERAVNVLLADHDAEEPVLTRPPQLGVPIDGTARAKELHRDLAKLSAQITKQSAPLLLYFAGHGTRDEKDEQNTRYDLWDGEALTVHGLAEEITHFSHQTPVVLVMAQCFSGAFANVLFQHGDPANSPAEQNIVGFFSARKDREAAGCSYATERADYQDFSSYFFGALSGHDRFGAEITGADYDGNGTVSLHEAFCYALIHDASADTPVCTSDVFLLHKAQLPNATIYATPYTEVRTAASPAQRAVLDTLSERLGLTGETRALTVFDRLTYGDPASAPALLKEQTDAKERLKSVRRQFLPTLFEHWPSLRWGETKSESYGKAFDGAVAELTKSVDVRRSLLEAEKAHEQADEAVDDEEALLIRFATIYEAVVEAHEVREHGTPTVRAQFARIWNAEQATLK